MRALNMVYTFNNHKYMAPLVQNVLNKRNQQAKVEGISYEDNTVLFYRIKSFADTLFIMIKWEELLPTYK